MNNRQCKKRHQNPSGKLVNGEVYLNRRETAEMLSVSESTIWRWVRGHVIPFHILGKRVVFKQSELTNYLNHGTDAG